MDEDGCLRLFEIRTNAPYLWHSVVSWGDRWSFGLILNDHAAERLKQMCLESAHTTNDEDD